MPEYVKTKYFLNLHSQNEAQCPGGGIGRHTSLRGWRRQKRASSSLVLGTEKTLQSL